MSENNSRWLLLPAILFLGAGLVRGGGDLPGMRGLTLLAPPLILLIIQLIRPTSAGWRLAFVSFTLLILATATLDLAAAVPRGLPPLSASSAMVVYFAVQFGVPAWLIWLARPRDAGRRGRRPLERRPLETSANGKASPDSHTAALGVAVGGGV